MDCTSTVVLKPSYSFFDPLLHYHDFSFASVCHFLFLHCRITDSSPIHIFSSLLSLHRISYYNLNLIRFSFLFAYIVNYQNILFFQDLLSTPFLLNISRFLANADRTKPIDSLPIVCLLHFFYSFSSNSSDESDTLNSTSSSSANSSQLSPLADAICKSNISGIHIMLCFHLQHSKLRSTNRLILKNLYFRCNLSKRSLAFCTESGLAPILAEKRPEIGKKSLTTALRLLLLLLEEGHREAQETLCQRRDQAQKSWSVAQQNSLYQCQQTEESSLLSPPATSHSAASLSQSFSFDELALYNDVLHSLEYTNILANVNIISTTLSQKGKHILRTLKKRYLKYIDQFQKDREEDQSNLSQEDFDNQLGPYLDHPEFHSYPLINEYDSCSDFLNETVEQEPSDSNVDSLVTCSSSSTPLTLSSSSSVLSREQSQHIHQLASALMNEIDGNTLLSSEDFFSAAAEASRRLECFEEMEKQKLETE